MTRFCLALATLALGCGGSLPGRCEDGTCGTQSSWRTTFQTTVNRKVDVLFVVDDTPAIAPHAGALAAAYPAMAQALEWLPQDGPASLHVGFIGAGGCAAGSRAAACGLAPPERFMRAEWCETKTNFASTFGGTFACLADLGAADCAPAQPVAAALSLLGGPPPEGWEGFLRSDASLMIVIVAASDDASGAPGQVTPVPALAALLGRLKPDPSQLMLSVVGPKDCSTGELQAPRLRELVVGFGGNALTAACVTARSPTRWRVSPTASPWTGSGHA